MSKDEQALEHEYKKNNKNIILKELIMINKI